MTQSSDDHLKDPVPVQTLESSQAATSEASVASSEPTSSEALRKWNEEVMAHMKRISADENYRLEISKKLS